MASVPTVTHNAAASRFEAPTAHGMAVLRYAVRGDVLDLTHTSVPAEAEGKGIGSALAHAALEHARANGLKVVPSCPFVRTYLEHHKEFAGLVVAR
jgi:predicted GNAT family acetyltransferase